MFEGILKAVEKTIELIKTKEKNNKEFFELIINPLYNEFEEVAVKYFELFTRKSITPEDATAIRDSYIQSRIKVTELAETYKNAYGNNEITKLFQAITDFFFDDFKVRLDTGKPVLMSGGEEYIELISGKIEYISTFENEYHKEEMLDSLKKKLAEVLRAYGEIKLKYSLPIGYKP
jgi:hypothetical protein